MLASRRGQILNETGLASPLGVSIPTATQWLSILEITGVIVVVSPFFENFGKRLIKSPKLYFVDSGLACHLFGIDSETALRRSPFLGAVFEGFVAAEIVKIQSALGRRKELCHFRDQQGLKVDFLVSLGGARLALIDAKASTTVHQSDGERLVRLAKAVRKHEPRCYVVQQEKAHQSPSAAFLPSVKAVGVRQLRKILRGRAV